jgi:hypothetical protein
MAASEGFQTHAVKHFGVLTPPMKGGDVAKLIEEVLKIGDADLAIINKIGDKFIK